VGDKQTIFNFPRGHASLRGCDPATALQLVTLQKSWGESELLYLLSPRLWLFSRAGFCSQKLGHSHYTCLLQSYSNLLPSAGEAGCWQPSGRGAAGAGLPQAPDPAAVGAGGWRGRPPPGSPSDLTPFVALRLCGTSQRCHPCLGTAGQ